jgi:NDP-sugar pyrophosphorylase family protein
MRAMVLAAGLGARLEPLTEFLPKPLLPVANRPVIHHLLVHLSRHGVTEAAVNVHAFADAVQAYVGDGSALGVTVRWSVEPELLGTAGGTKAVEDYLGDETVLVLSGDDVHDVDLTALLEQHRRTEAQATLAVRSVADPSGFGIVVTDPTDAIVGFQEKPSPDEARSNLASCGIYAVEPEVLARIPAGAFVDFGRDVWPALARRPGALRAFTTTTYWNPLRDLGELRLASLDALTGRVRLDLPGDEIAHGIRAEDGCSIDVTATVEGPLVIGKNVVVEADAKVRGPAVIGAHSRVGVGSAVSEAVLLPGTVVPDDGVVLGGLVGEASTLASTLERYPAGATRVWN